MRRTPLALLLVAALALAACSRAESATPAAAAPAGHAAGATGAAHAQPQGGQRPRLVFFMNPNGRPCQLQDQILRSLGPELAGRADVVYYRTTVGEELAQFQAYGVRSLPLLLVTDANGRELRRATPGIQEAPQVRALLGL